MNNSLNKIKNLMEHIDHISEYGSSNYVFEDTSIKPEDNTRTKKNISTDSLSDFFNTNYTDDNFDKIISMVNADIIEDNIDEEMKSYFPILKSNLENILNELSQIHNYNEINIFYTKIQDNLTALRDLSGILINNEHLKKLSEKLKKIINYINNNFQVETIVKENFDFKSFKESQMKTLGNNIKGILPSAPFSTTGYNDLFFNKSNTSITDNNTKYMCYDNFRDEILGDDKKILRSFLSSTMAQRNYNNTFFETNKYVNYFRQAIYNILQNNEYGNTFITKNLGENTFLFSTLFDDPCVDNSTRLRYSNTIATIVFGEKKQNKKSTISLRGNVDLNEGKTNSSNITNGTVYSILSAIRKFYNKHKIDDVSEFNTLQLLVKCKNIKPIGRELDDRTIITTAYNIFIGLNSEVSVIPTDSTVNSGARTDYFNNYHGTANALSSVIDYNDKRQDLEDKKNISLKEIEKLSELMASEKELDLSNIVKEKKFDFELLLKDEGLKESFGLNEFSTDSYYYQIIKDGLANLESEKSLEPEKSKLSFKKFIVALGNSYDVNNPLNKEEQAVFDSIKTNFEDIKIGIQLNSNKKNLGEENRKNNEKFLNLKKNEGLKDAFEKSEIDIYLPDYNIFIENQGPQHYRTKFTEALMDNNEYFNALFPGESVDKKIINYFEKINKLLVFKNSNDSSQNDEKSKTSIKKDAYKKIDETDEFKSFVGDKFISSKTKNELTTVLTNLLTNVNNIEDAKNVLNAVSDRFSGDDIYNKLVDELNNNDVKKDTIKHFLKRINEDNKLLYWRTIIDEYKKDKNNTIDTLVNSKARWKEEVNLVLNMINDRKKADAILSRGGTMLYTTNIDFKNDNNKFLVKLFLNEPFQNIYDNVFHNREKNANQLYKDTFYNSKITGPGDSIATSNDENIEVDYADVKQEVSENILLKAINELNLNEEDTNNGIPKFIDRIEQIIKRQNKNKKDGI